MFGPRILERGRDAGANQLVAGAIEPSLAQFRQPADAVVPLGQEGVRTPIHSRLSLSGSAAQRATPRAHR